MTSGWLYPPPASQSQVDDIRNQVSNALPKDSGTATNLKISTTPTDDQHAVRKADLDATTIVLPSRTVAITRSIPSAVTGIWVLGYATPGDGGQANWVRAGTQPSHPGKFRSADGAWWELAGPRLDPKMLGAKCDGVTNDTAAVQATFDVVQTKSAPFGAQVCLPGQPSLRFTAGAYNAPGLILDSQATGFAVECDGPTTRLMGIGFRFGGNRQAFTGMPTLSDAGTIGIERYNQNARTFICTGAIIRDRTFGLVISGGGQDDITNVSVEKCQDGLVANGGGSTQIVNCEFITCSRYGVRYNAAGEVKLVNCRALGNGQRNLYLYGTNFPGAAIEDYFVGCTFTVAQRTRIIPALGVADNGSGYARVTYASELAVTSLEDRGARLVVLPTASIATACLNIGNNAGGSLTGLTIGGIQALGSTITWTGDRSTMATAVAVAVNATTAAHGVTATTRGSRIYFTTSAANTGSLTWAAIVPTVADGLVVQPTAYMAIKTATAHGLAVGDDVDVNVGAFVGIQRVEAVEDATTFCVEAYWSSASVQTGTAVKAHRLQDGMRDVQFGAGAYAGQRIISNVTPTTFDINLPYTAPWSGQATLPNWDVEIDAYEDNYRTNDQFFVGGNINYLLVRSGFNIQFRGTRLKLQRWVDPCIKISLRAARIEFDVPSRGRGDNVFDDILTGGATSGWSVRGMRDLTGSSVPGGECNTLEIPSASAQNTGNSVSDLNGVRAFRDRIEMRVAGVVHSITSLAWNLFGHQIATVVNAVNFLKLTAAIAGGRVEIAATGADTDIGMGYVAKGAGKHEFFAAGARAAQVRGASASVNYPYLSSNIAGGRVVVGVDGTDAAIHLQLGVKGGGTVYIILPVAASDSAAAALSPAVPINGLYRTSDGTVRVRVA